MSDQEETKPRPKPRRREKGIFGIPKSKNRTFFSPNDEDWSSDESDEDFKPEVAPAVEKEKGEREEEEEEDGKKLSVRRRKNAKKILRIESDDDVEDDDDGDASFVASDSDDESVGGSGRKKGKGGGKGTTKKQKSYVEDSDDSHEENFSAKKKRNVTRKSYVENSDEEETAGVKRRKPPRPSSLNDFVVDSDEEFAEEETPSGDSADESYSGSKSNKRTASRKKKTKKKPTTATKRPKKIDLSSEDDFDYDDGDDSDEYEPTKAKRRRSKLSSNNGKRTEGTTKRMPSSESNNREIASSLATKKRCQAHRGRGGAGGRGGGRGGRNSSSSRKRQSTSLADDHLPNSNGAVDLAARPLTREELMLGWRWANHLPLHVLVKIFQMVVSVEGSIPFLLHVEQISPSWDSAAQTATLWKRVDLSGGWANLDVRKFTQLCKNQFRHLAELTLPSFALVNEALPLLATHCSSTLVSLGLPGCRKLKEAVVTQHIPQSFPNLRALDLSDVSEHHRKFFKPVVSAMGDKLVSLNVSRNVITGLPALIQSIISNCPSIEFLDMSNIHGNFHQSLKISQFQKACPRLKTLRMAGMNIVSTDNQDEIAEMRGFPLLEDLSLAQTEDLMSSAHMLNSSYNHTLRLLLASSNELKLLDIRGLRGLTASGLDIALFGPALNTYHTKEPQLHHLFWSGVSKCDIPSGCPLGSDMDFRQLITSLRRTLLTLDLSQNIFPPSHLDALCAAFERGRLAGDSGPPLSDLNLASTNVEESHVRRLLTSCDNLSSINLSGSRALPRDMKKFYQGDAFLELKGQMI